LLTGTSASCLRISIVNKKYRESFKILT
jgi:hypothetical protein